MKVKMTRTERGSRDGVFVDSFHEGETYDLPDDLARVFIAELHCAEEVLNAGDPIEKIGEVVIDMDTTSDEPRKKKKR